MIEGKISAKLWLDDIEGGRDFSILKGKTISKITATAEVVLFYTNDGRVYKLFHDQVCCEGVYLEDVCGDWDDLLNSPILLAEEVTQELGESIPDWAKAHLIQEILSKEEPVLSEYTRWTFYKLSTIKGSVTLRWCGESQYYSVSVDFEQIIN